MARSELDSVREWYGYNAFARAKYFDLLAKLPAEELQRDRGASFPTLLDILGHSLGGIETWVMRMLAAREIPYPKYDGPDPDSVEELRRYEKWVQGGVDALFAQLTADDLDRSFLVPKLPPWWDEDFTTSFRSTLLHIVEHELQHRGELNALLWHINIDPPIVDWGEYEEARDARAPRPPAP